MELFIRNVNKIKAIAHEIGDVDGLCKWAFIKYEHKADGTISLFCLGYFMGAKSLVILKGNTNLGCKAQVQLTFEFLDNTIPIIKALATRLTVRYLSRCSSCAAVTFVATNSW